VEECDVRRVDESMVFVSKAVDIDKSGDGWFAAERPLWARRGCVCVCVCVVA